MGGDRHYFWAKNGDFQGSCEMPKQFVGVYHDAIEQIRAHPTHTFIPAQCEVLSRYLLDCPLPGFADDMFRKRPLSLGLTSDQVISNIAESDRATNTILTQRKSFQNMAKKDIIPHFGSTVANRRWQEECSNLHGEVQARTTSRRALHYER
eukprot:2969860-Pyramimonas_sp.AAC.1